MELLGLCFSRFTLACGICVYFGKFRLFMAWTMRVFASVSNLWIHSQQSPTNQTDQTNMVNSERSIEHGSFTMLQWISFATFKQRFKLSRWLCTCIFWVYTVKFKNETLFGCSLQWQKTLKIFLFSNCKTNDVNVVITVETLVYFWTHHSTFRWLACCVFVFNCLLYWCENGLKWLLNCWNDSICIATLSNAIRRVVMHAVSALFCFKHDTQKLFQIFFENKNIYFTFIWRYN